MRSQASLQLLIFLAASLAIAIIFLQLINNLGGETRTRLTGAEKKLMVSNACAMEAELALQLGYAEIALGNEGNASAGACGPEYQKNPIE